MEVEKPPATPAMAASDGSSKSVKGNLAVSVVPSSRGHRPWKKPKRRTAAAQRRTGSLKLSLEQKNRRREERAALVLAVRAAREADAAAKETERKRRLEKKKRKEENVQRGTQKLVISNPKKIAKMSKKQYLNYLKQSGQMKK